MQYENGWAKAVTDDGLKDKGWFARLEKLNSGAELTRLNQLVDVHRRSRLGGYRLCRLLVGQAPLSRARKITGFHLNRVTPLGAAPSEHLRARLA